MAIANPPTQILCQVAGNSSRRPDVTIRLLPVCFGGKGVFGAPPISTTQLQNYRSGDLCFKGTRLFNYDDAPTAAVPTLATVLVSRHPKVEAIASQKAMRVFQAVHVPCHDASRRGSVLMAWCSESVATNGIGGLAYSMAPSMKFTAARTR